MKLRSFKFVFGIAAVLLALCLISAAMVASNEQAYANSVPARILPLAIQHDQALIAQAANLPKAPASKIPTQIFSGQVTQAELMKTIGEFTSPILPFAELDKNFNVTFNQVIQAQATANPITATQTALTTDAICFSGVCGWELGSAIIVFAGIAIACGAITASTLGWGAICFAALIVAVTAFFLLNYLLSQLTAGEIDTYRLAAADIVSFNEATSAVALSVYNTWTVIANSLGTFAAEAEAAALAQLGGPWSQAWDILNSTIGASFAGFELSEYSAITTQFDSLYQEFATGFTGNPGCALQVGTGSGTFPSGGQWATAYGSGSEGQLCASPVPHGGEVNGVAPSIAPLQAWGVATCSGTPSPATSPDTFYIGAGIPSNSPDSIVVGSFNLTYAIWGSGTISVYALNGTLLGTTIAATSYGSWSNWTFGFGGFMLCSSDGATIGLEASFPINDATESANVASATQTNPESLAFFGPNPAFTGSQPESVTMFNAAEIVGYGDIGICSASIYGNGSGNLFSGNTCMPAQSGGATVLSNLTYLLYTAAHTAAVYGEAYWAFLSYIGFSNANQLPTACLIPTPSQLVPPDIGLKAIEDMSVFQLLVAYTAELAALNATFNNTATMPTTLEFNVCGLTAPVIVCGDNFSGALNQTLAQYLTEANITPTDPSWWTCSFGLSTEGIGYVYSGTGTVGSTLADARSWLTGFSGVLYSAGVITLSGGLAGLGPIPINQTWNLPLVSANPTSVTVQDFSNATDPYYADPYGCLLNASKTPQNGSCGLTGPVGLFMNPAAGNSTLRNGSALGTHEQSFAGAAVYLVGCLVVTGGSIFNVSSSTQTSGDCNFTSVNWTWGETYCELHPNAPQCQVGCNPTQANNYCCEVNCGGYNFCLQFPIVSTFTVLLGNWLATIGFGGVNLGGLGQAIGCIVGVIVLAVAVAGGIYAVYWVVRRK